MIDSAGHLSRIVNHLRRQELLQARHASDVALAAHPQDGRLNAIAGLVACQMNDLSAGIRHFDAALSVMPGDLATRINLVRTQLAMENFIAAIEVSSAQDDPRLVRLRAYAHWQAGFADAAAMDYLDLLKAVPEDYESWSNLGNLSAERGAIDDAIEAFERAIRIRPDLPVLYLNYSRGLARHDRHQARGSVMRVAVEYFPGAVDILIEHGLAEAGVQDYPAAESAYRRAIRHDPKCTPAYVELAMLLESLNRLEEMAALIDNAQIEGVSGDGINFVKAWIMRRQGRFVEALPIAESIGLTIDPVRRFQLIGEIHDRLGNAGAAFEAFTAMNLAVSIPAELRRPGQQSFREAVADVAFTNIREQAMHQSRPAINPVPQAPIFIVGFPRSGTTLTDTLLMNLPSLHVMEEQPVMRRLEEEIANVASLDLLTQEQAQEFRQRYFTLVEEICPGAVGQRIVDKFPLHMVRMPLINRIFPDASIVLVERHPCDVVLSCFMSNFQPNRAMIHFLDLEETAKLYDTVWNAWTQATTSLPLRVHVIRYERMVEDLESEMRPLLDFLGIAWTPEVLDNSGSATRRKLIQTASYAQVIEPIYARARDRWRRYEQQMAPVLPLLAPWVQRLGYKL